VDFGGWDQTQIPLSRRDAARGFTHSGYGQGPVHVTGSRLNPDSSKSCRPGTDRGLRLRPPGPAPGGASRLVRQPLRPAAPQGIKRFLIPGPTPDAWKCRGESRKGSGSLLNDSEDPRVLVG